MSKGIVLSIAVAAILLGIVFSYRSAVLSRQGGDDVPAYAISRHDPYGTGALKDLLVERGISVKALEQPTLDSDDHGVLIQVLPFSQSGRQASRFRLQTSQVVDWIASGNTVIQLTRGPTDLMNHLKVTATTQPAKQMASVENAEASGTLPTKMPGNLTLARIDSADKNTEMNLLRGKALTIRSPMEFAAQQKGINWQQLARTRNGRGAVVAGELAIGKGKLVLIGGPTPVLNGTIGDEANLDFLLTEIKNGPVIFDEWSHGVGHEATIMGLIRDVGLLPALFQIAFIAVLYMWSTSGRLQREDARPPRERSSAEQIETLGFLYNRSLGDEITFQRVTAEVRRRLGDALGCTSLQLEARTATLSPKTAGKMQTILERLKLSQPPTSVRCESCGYDLTLNQSGRCPECGSDIFGEMRNRTERAGRGSHANPKQSRTRRDAVFADVLGLSHQLAKEIKRERRSV